uniref:Ribonuclease H n=1 Tax=Pithovirus LCPAC302 TaxID=2506593 RepID=A0A481Z6F2_9VIRU|nr:MAG: ribonuclease H [Pithovirus LCPAC302]
MNKLYAVRNGRNIGIFTSWKQTELQVRGFRNAKFKSFTNMNDAKNYLNSGVSNENITEKNAIYTDGSCKDDIGGYGIVINKEKEISGKVLIFPCTNQIAELYAIYQAIIYCKNKDNITIYTDSKYSIGCLTEWHRRWEKNGWVNAKGNNVKNKILIKAILDISSDISVSYKHVKAHNGNKYNEIADKLANEGRLK